MRRRPVIAALLLIPLAAARLGAQTMLFAEDNGKMAWVRGASGTDPCVEKDGKLVTIRSQGFALKEVSDYLPVFVSVQKISARTQFNNTGTGSGDFKGWFFFSAEVQSSYRLDNVFIVLDMTIGGTEKSYFIQEVGNLEANRVKIVSAAVPIVSAEEAGTYLLHLFCGGEEVLQSTIPFEVREAALSRMVAARIPASGSSPPRLFLGAPPDYPRSLEKANLRGEARISIEIAPNGVVYDTVVKSASDPAFGQAALVAIRMWRFIPAVKDGVPVRTAAVVPFVFNPPSPDTGTH
jgi:TonB family protein